MANTKLTKTLEQGVLPDAFDLPDAPEEGLLPPEATLKERRKAAKREIKPCRTCGLPLPRGAEYTIGVHIWCVAKSKFNRVKIPRPTYGTRKR
jgi:hypothetical protein